MILRKVQRIGKCEGRKHMTEINLIWISIFLFEWTTIKCYMYPLFVWFVCYLWTVVMYFQFYIDFSWIFLMLPFHTSPIQPRFSNSNTVVRFFDIILFKRQWISNGIIIKWADIRCMGVNNENLYLLFRHNFSKQWPIYDIIIFGKTLK